MRNVLMFLPAVYMEGEQGGGVPVSGGMYIQVLVCSRRELNLSMRCYFPACTKLQDFACT